MEEMLNTVLIVSFLYAIYAYFTAPDTEINQVTTNADDSNETLEYNDNGYELMTEVERWKYDL